MADAQGKSVTWETQPRSPRNMATQGIPRQLAQLRLTSVLRRCWAHPLPGRWQLPVPSTCILGELPNEGGAKTRPTCL